MAIDRISRCWTICPIRSTETQSQKDSMVDRQETFEDLWTHDDCFEDSTSLPRSSEGLIPDRDSSTNLVKIYHSVQTCFARLIEGGLEREESTRKEIRYQYWQTVIAHQYHTPPAMPKDFGNVRIYAIYSTHCPELFIAHKGYLSKSGKEARVGDVFVIFDGSDVPFVIRETPSDDYVRWKLAGECYLCGWMDRSYSDHRIVDDVDDGLATADTKPNADSSYKKETLLSEYLVLC